MALQELSRRDRLIHKIAILRSSCKHCRFTYNSVGYDPQSAFKVRIRIVTYHADDCNFFPLPDLRISMHGSSTENNGSLPSYTSGRPQEEATLTLTDSVGQKIDILLQNRLGEGGQRHVVVYCPVWMVNTSNYSLR